MLEFKDPLDVIMWMVFVALAFAVIFTVVDQIIENREFKKENKKGWPGTTPTIRPFKPGQRSGRIK